MYVDTYNTNGIIDTNRSIFQSTQNLHQLQHQQQQQILRRGKISDVWGTLNKARSTPDLLGDRCLEEEDEEDEDDENNGNEDENSSVIEKRLIQLHEPASIFNRPGFGSVAFRRSVSFFFFFYI